MLAKRTVAGLAGAIWLAVASVLPTSAMAGFNVPVAVRVVSFLQPPPSGKVPGAIIFDPGNKASVSEAAAIESAVGSGLSAGRATLQVRRVPVDSLSRLTGVSIAFVTQGLRDQQSEIAALSARRSILTISSDPACVAAARCVVGISATPKVQITVSRTAARASKIQFSSAFLMLVEEVD